MTIAKLLFFPEESARLSKLIRIAGEYLMSENPLREEMLGNLYASGRTVVEYINRLLLMEAIWLLESTSLSIDEIAERINYADSTTFGRFFFRMKGVTPREYRKSL